MRYQILALDLDGTLTNEKKEITPRTRTALRRAIERGVHVVLASGRPLIGVAPVGVDLELDRLGGYLLAYNGGQIADCRTGEVIYEKTVPRDWAIEVCRAGSARGLATLTYDETGILTETPDDPFVAREAYNCHIPIRAVDDLFETVTWPVVKYMVVGEPERLAAFQRDMQARYEGRLSLFFSLPYFMEVLAPGIDKPVALDRLARHLGLGRESVMACGDGLNDISMLRYAGLGVAMGNAFPETRAAADVVTGSNEEDGVAMAVSRYLLGE